MPKKVRDIKFKTSTVTICYARNGHRLFKGKVENITSWILDYYTDKRSIIVNKITNNTYLEVTEDTLWWEGEWLND